MIGWAFIIAGLVIAYVYYRITFRILHCDKCKRLRLHRESKPMSWKSKPLFELWYCINCKNERRM